MPGAVSLDADPFADTSRPVGVTVNDAVGGGLAGACAVTVTLRVVVEAAPSSSVTVSVTVYVPAAA